MLCIGDSVGPDIARGEGLDESSSDDDDDDEGESNQRTGMKQFFMLSYFLLRVISAVTVLVRSTYLSENCILVCWWWQFDWSWVQMICTELQ